MLVACSSNTDIDTFESKNEIDNDVFSCTDGIKNGTEIDIDCGGDCPDCAEEQIESSLPNGTIKKILSVSELGYVDYSIHNFTVDENSNIWMVHPEYGTLHYDGSNWIRIDEFSGIFAQGFNATTSISTDRNNIGWISLSENLYKFDTGGLKWIPIKTNLDNITNQNVAVSPFLNVPHFHSKNGGHWFFWENKFGTGDQYFSVLETEGGFLQKTTGSSPLMSYYPDDTMYIDDQKGYYIEKNAGEPWDLVPIPQEIETIGRGEHNFITDGKYWRIMGAFQNNPQAFYYVDVENFSNLEKWSKKSGNEFEEYPNGKLFHDSKDRVWFSSPASNIMWKFNSVNLDFDKVIFPSEKAPRNFVQGKDGKIYFLVNTTGRLEITTQGSYNIYDEIWEWTPEQ